MFQNLKEIKKLSDSELFDYLYGLKRYLVALAQEEKGKDYQTISRGQKGEKVTLFLEKVIRDFLIKGEFDRLAIIMFIYDNKLYEVQSEEEIVKEILNSL